MKKKRILVAPLDWGLGHASRCIPIIRELQRQGAEVIIGADKLPLALLRSEFPEAEWVQFPGTSIQYPDSGNMAWKIIQQFPGILIGFLKEHRFLRQIIVEKKIDVVISDSRHGLFTKKIPCVIVIHQIRILMSPSLRWAEHLVSLINKIFIRRYTECWIPDFAGEPNITGKLSHDMPLPNNAYYIGQLSRMNRIQKKKKKFDIIAVLSGPEPQRSKFEKLLIDQLKETNLTAIIARGKTDEHTNIKLSNNITLVSFVTGEEFSTLLSHSEILISRSGHSTLMDMCYTGGNAVFVPTPQQTEHEYLAKRLKEQNICYYETQSEFNLQRALVESKKYSGFSKFSVSNEVLQDRISKLLMLED